MHWTKASAELITQFVSIQALKHMCEETKYCNFLENAQKPFRPIKKKSDLKHFVTTVNLLTVNYLFSENHLLSPSSPPRGNWRKSPRILILIISISREHQRTGDFDTRHCF